ncbi:hypothetical protein M407DRAFT_24741 [Tulasnella calospora MUT 4182]|uniref:Uncharacterized protein n=1 Tax=Tulasnella calospora MUT 4182 TaxID=1051891 RepID=A0A0C3QHA5_9AGAM|nr:hypothetical protein M407DRAFT_24741 [Tulasnella calospora MUT 4182]
MQKEPSPRVAITSPYTRHRLPPPAPSQILCRGSRISHTALSFDGLDDEEIRRRNRTKKNLYKLAAFSQGGRYHHVRQMHVIIKPPLSKATLDVQTLVALVCVLPRIFVHGQRPGQTFPPIVTSSTSATPFLSIHHVADTKPPPNLTQLIMQYGWLSTRIHPTWGWYRATSRWLK